MVYYTLQSLHTAGPLVTPLHVTGSGGVVKGWGKKGLKEGNERGRKGKGEGRRGGGGEKDFGVAPL